MTSSRVNVSDAFKWIALDECPGGRGRGREGTTNIYPDPPRMSVEALPFGFEEERESSVDLI